MTKKYCLPLTCCWLMVYGFPAQIQAAEDISDLPQYQLDSGDHIHIQVFQEDDLTRDVVVNDRGQISFPFIGDMDVRGMTSDELGRQIAARLEGDYLINPRVFVDIQQYRPFYVNGEVIVPGDFPFQPGITVRKAISIAGGLKERASVRRIFVVRESEGNEPFKAELDTLVNPGDIITVEQGFF